MHEEGVILEVKAFSLPVLQMLAQRLALRDIMRDVVDPSVAAKEALVWKEGNCAFPEGVMLTYW